MSPLLSLSLSECKREGCALPVTSHVGWKWKIVWLGVQPGSLNVRLHERISGICPKNSPFPIESWIRATQTMAKLRNTQSTIPVGSQGFVCTLFTLELALGAHPLKDRTR